MSITTEPIHAQVTASIRTEQAAPQALSIFAGTLTATARGCAAAAAWGPAILLAAAIPIAWLINARAPGRKAPAKLNGTGR